MPGECARDLAVVTRFTAQQIQDFLDVLPDTWDAEHAERAVVRLNEHGLHLPYFTQLLTHLPPRRWL